MLCVEVSSLLKFCIATGIGSLLEHSDLVLVLHGIGQDTVMVFWVFFGQISLSKSATIGV